ncbi:nitroreductase [Nocardiopsis sp. CT-R113]|uniref:Nitroreductase n=1 Tax=Nocardiopsis codii TaxID=3065942 RepID=A0ABU7K4C3_9ACTN|nr:nitroreductase [Nocardiopsis sp. CT-R113]MEE2037099.1 nitroreductase [Nocardiopsis sp. CT-R113]
MPDSPRSFTDIVRSRRSVRGFLPDPVPAADIRAVLEDAQRAPSNCNTQPWQVHVVSGAHRDALSAALLQADRDGRFSSDFSFDYADFGDGLYLQRAQKQGAAYYQSLGVERSDTQGRHAAALRNLEFFGAPHVALLFLPQFGDGVRVAGDMGMYAQTFLLALEARGLAGIPQTMLGSYADVVRGSLDIKSDMKLLFGISFGLADPQGPASAYRMGRAPLAESVVLHGTPGVLDGAH